MSTQSSLVEAYLLQIVPNLADEWEGASEEEIARIQQLTPHPLPEFYQWFLRRMGRSMGPVEYPKVDFSPQRILAVYADEDDEILPSDQHLLIGYNNDEMMPLHLFYDLEVRNRDDALVLQRAAAGGERRLSFETLAEMLVWGESSRCRVDTRPQRCSGSFTDQEYAPFACTDAVMERLGFRQPVPMGDACRVYEREDATMVCSGDVLRPRGDKFRFFDLGAADVATIRSILGTIAAETRLLVEADEWEPELSEP